MSSIPIVDGLPADRISAVFYQQGAVLFRECLPREWIEQARTHLMQQFDHRLKSAQTLLGGDLGIGRDKGFAEIVQRSPRRYDLSWEMEPPFTDPILTDNEIIMPALRAILGEDCRIALQGVVVSLPDAAEQMWHIDGPHLYLDQPHHLPAHCINVFIPLIDVTAHNGATEVCLESHFLTRSKTRTFKAAADNLTAIGSAQEPVTLTAPAGSVCLFDYRLLHRGLANRSSDPRPVLYLVVARSWYRETTFPARRLSELVRPGG